MTPVWYARCFLLAPLMVSFGMSAAKPLLSIIPSGPLALLGAYFFAGAWLARTPYAVFAVSALAFLWCRNAEAHFRLARMAPFAFLPFFGCYIYLTGALGRTGGSLLADIAGIASWLLITLPFGYVYVGLFFLGARVVFGASRPTNESGNAV